jgi:hypothetical protein
MRIDMPNGLSLPSLHYDCCLFQRQRAIPDVSFRCRKTLQRCPEPDSASMVLKHEYDVTAVQSVWPILKSLEQRRPKEGAMGQTIRMTTRMGPIKRQRSGILCHDSESTGFKVVPNLASIEIWKDGSREQKYHWKRNDWF